MNIDLGWLGKVRMEEMEEKYVFGTMTFIMDGYTESGIRVQMVIDTCKNTTYPRCWRDTILIA